MDIKYAIHNQTPIQNGLSLGITRHTTTGKDETGVMKTHQCKYRCRHVTHHAWTYIALYTELLLSLVSHDLPANTAYAPIRHQLVVCSEAVAQVQQSST